MSDRTIVLTMCRVCQHRQKLHTEIGECGGCGGNYCDGFDDDGEPQMGLWERRVVVLPDCDRDGCTEPVEGYGRRFCTPHRREHGRSLLVQLEALTMGRDRR